MVCSALEQPVIFAVNDVGAYLPKVNHWVTLHGAYVHAWSNVRWNHLLGRVDNIHAISDDGFEINHVWDGLTPLMSLSGYFAMQIAHIMGAGEIILCGCPGNSARRFFDLTMRDDLNMYEGCRRQLIEECQRLPELKAKVRSTSGWTKEFFGGPK